MFIDIIRKKRDGHSLSAQDIAAFVDGLSDESVPVEQVSALAMAIFLNSMSFEEAGQLTLSMANSGTTLDWHDLGVEEPIVDKHSTGGVGDKVSLILAPMAAACGCFVPMISGRGLGHGGGTLDKIESIPGYNATPELKLFRSVVKQTGCAIIGQTADLAPADRRLYSIRDISGTVESVPLITASILSKKIAGGVSALVMDVKVGSGAFMKTMGQAQELAKSLIGTAASAGLRTHALITDMNQVLGLTAGNAVEVVESIQFLRNEYREPRLNEVVLNLCVEMLLLAGIETDRDAARIKADRTITSGRAAEVFDQMVVGLGGPVNLVNDYEQHLPVAKVKQPVFPKKQGFLNRVDTLAVGYVVVGLGGGRRKLSDELDLSVGLTEFTPVGGQVGPDQPIAMVHAATEEDASEAADKLTNACIVTDARPDETPVIYQLLT